MNKKNSISFLNIKEIEKKRIDKEWQSAWGQFKKIINKHNYTVYAVQTSGRGNQCNLKLHVKAFDEGVSFKYEIENKKKFSISEDLTSFHFAEDLLYTSSRGEHAPQLLKPLSKRKLAGIKNYGNIPVVLVNKEKQYSLALLESAPIDFSPMWIASNKENPLELFSEIMPSKNIQMPWRIILVSDNPGNFLTSTLALNLAKESKIKDTSWIKVGVSTWDWRAFGAEHNGFKYQNNTETMKRFIDFSAENNFPFFLADAYWADIYNNPLKSVKSVDIKEVIQYGKKKGIGVFLYYDLGYMRKAKMKEIDFEKVAKTFSEMGATGIKYGFLGTRGPRLRGQKKSLKTMEIIRICAKYKLLVNFHDNPIAMPGIERTWPNSVTREYCHAQQDKKTGFDSNQFIRMAYINYVVGPMDQTNGVYAIKDNKKREKGVKNGILSTVASETARIGIISNGYITIPDAPEDYKNKADLFALIKDAPTSWDDTQFIKGEIEKYIVIFRRSGKKAWVFAANNGQVRTMEIDFSKLPLSKQRKRFKVEIGRDAEDTHYKTNPESYIVESKMVGSQEKIFIAMAAGGGFCLKIT